MRLATTAGVTLTLLLSAALDAQWLKYPTPGIPRLADGKPNLSAPAPRTADGKPEIDGLWRAAREVLTEWIALRIAETGEGFPEKVTAFHPRMAVHGKHGDPCAVCGAPIQRIVYADRETNYCPGCQTGGRILADRALSRILREDWPRTLEELEDTTRAPAGGNRSATNPSTKGSR